MRFNRRKFFLYQCGQSLLFLFSLWDSRWWGNDEILREHFRLSILSMRFESPRCTDTPWRTMTSFYSLYEIRSWVGSSLWGWCCSIFQFSLWDSWASTSFLSPILLDTFQFSLWDSLAGGLSGTFDNLGSFQFSLWDSVYDPKLGKYVVSIFQFSLWDSPNYRFALSLKNGLLAFNSLYEILYIKPYWISWVTRNFQFSLWDSY